MDINDFRTLATVLVFLSFVSIVWWAYGPSRRAYFDQAAQLPFDNEENDTQSKLNPAKGEQS
ncbi:MAG: cbb3-type cytochrome c oxidase subunit 3 [Pseudohongiella sp.]|nr:cbb3-type cytochrome c oxidase subunit 3 [Pseudohongiella sp.]MDO9522053.1 cbb3-type cytochrome c oxidase subunit 3 [Pseudohongiella sp.]MDP2128688.1 cbb3-type cytochrome c oxidase subunit 3 [Pseudohongiella sp.]